MMPHAMLPYSPPFAAPAGANLRAGLPHRLWQHLARHGVWYATGLNVFAVLFVLVMLHGVSERYWLGTALLFAPRSPWLISSAAVLIYSAFKDWRLVPVNACAAVLAAGPIMGFQWHGLVAAPLPGAGTEVRIVSCNVQGFRPDFAAVADEVLAARPDVVVFQEGYNNHPLLERLFDGWHRIWIEEYLVASRFPLEQLAVFYSEPFGRNAALAVKVLHPVRPFVLCDLHQSTPRYGLIFLKPKALIADSGAERLTLHISQREDESIAARQFVEQWRGELPLVVCGDFNMPSDSHLYQTCWGDLQNCFETASWGYGYSVPCQGNRFWPKHLPWARIDHILTSPEWQVRSAWTGVGNGSDHRLVGAVLVLPDTADLGDELATSDDGPPDSDSRALVSE